MRKLLIMSAVVFLAGCEGNIKLGSKAQLPPSKTFTVRTHFETYTGVGLVSYSNTGATFIRRGGTTVQVFGNIDMEEERLVTE